MNNFERIEKINKLIILIYNQADKNDPNISMDEIKKELESLINMHDLKIGELEVIYNINKFLTEKDEDDSEILNKVKQSFVSNMNYQDVILQLYISYINEVFDTDEIFIDAKLIIRVIQDRLKELIIEQIAGKRHIIEFLSYIEKQLSATDVLDTHPYLTKENVSDFIKDKIHNQIKDEKQKLVNIMNDAKTRLEEILNDENETAIYEEKISNKIKYGLTYENVLREITNGYNVLDTNKAGDNNESDI